MGTERTDGETTLQLKVRSSSPSTRRGVGRVRLRRGFERLRRRAGLRVRAAA